MELRVGDNRKSERRFVMKRIRIETSSDVKTGRLRCWSLSTKTVAESVKRRKQMMAIFGLAGALLAAKAVTDSFLLLLSRRL